MSVTDQRLVIFSCCVALAITAVQADSDSPTGPPLPREVVIGEFRCNVEEVEPPAGTGIPFAGASMGFAGTGDIGDIGQNVNLGHGEGLEEECQTLAAQMRNEVQTRNCAPGPTRFREIVGGNFIDQEWTFDVVCTDGRDRLMNAIGSLLTAIVSTPLAEVVIRTTGPIDAAERSQAPVDVRGWSNDAYPVKRRVSDR